MYSKHQNLNAEPNVPGLDPYYHHHARSGNVLASLALIVIGMILGAPVGAALSAGFRAYDKPAAPEILQTYLRADFCMTCHAARAEPVIKNYKEYKAEHPALSQKRLLQNLEGAR